MQIFASGNHRPSRLLTTFVALLYVFLSTFGVLTHAASHGDYRPGTRREAAAGRKCYGAASHAFTVSCRCAFCSWQANSVSPAVPIQHLESPATVTALVIVSPASRLPALRFVRASSRAPPLA